MKDNRFLPVQKREPVEDYDAYPEESSDEISIGSEAEAEELETLQPGSKKTKDVLYMAG